MPFNPDPNPRRPDRPIGRDRTPARFG